MDSRFDHLINTVVSRTLKGVETLLDNKVVPPLINIEQTVNDFKAPIARMDQRLEKVHNVVVGDVNLPTINYCPPQLVFEFLTRMESENVIWENRHLFIRVKSDLRKQFREWLQENHKDVQRRGIHNLSQASQVLVGVLDAYHVGNAEDKEAFSGCRPAQKYYTKFKDGTQYRYNIIVDYAMAE
jgi:hypothetical protein